MKKTAILRGLGPLIGMSLFGAALWVLQHTLAEYNYHDIVTNLSKLPTQQLLLALLWTGLSYLTMTGYDLLAMRYIRSPLPWIKVGFAAFVSYAFSNTVGLSVLTSGSVRYRLYSSWGLTAVEITKVVIFTSLTLWLSILTIGGGILAFMSLNLPIQLHLPFADTKPLGLLMLIAPAGYLLLGIVRRQPFRFRQWELPMVRTRLALSQLMVGILDWAIAGTVLYVLLPPSDNLSFVHFLGVFLVAQTAGLISHVPGGLGVFESLIILMLSPYIPVANELGALLAYRIIYYLLPLALATVGLGIHEGWRHTQRVLWLPRVVGPWIPVLLPQALALMALASGALLLFSAATPVVATRLDWFRGFMPLAVLELGHFIGSLVGIGLLLLARGLQRRLDTAWLLTVVLLLTGIAASLLKGFDYEEALVLSALLAGLLPCRRDCYRRIALLDERLTAGWITTIALILICTLWLGLFSYKQLTYSNTLWWEFSSSNHGDAPRFLRAMAGVWGIALAFALAKWLRRAPFQVALPNAQELRQLPAIIAAGGETYPHLALLGDKALLFNRARTAFIMYGVEGRTWAAMGDPVAPSDEERRELAWEFRELCEHFGGWTVFYQAHPNNLDLYVELGLTLLKIGETARVPLANGSLQGRAHKGMYSTLRRLAREGCRFEMVQPEAVAALLPTLSRVSEAWLGSSGGREKGFSLGFFKEDYLRLCPVAVVRRGEAIIAFATLWLGGGKQELSLDLLRYLPDTPPGLADYLFIQAMRWGREQGYAWFNLGMAPLVGLQNRSLAPLWNRFSASAFVQNDQLFNFRSLRQSKDKFQPRWEPCYLAVPGGISLPHILTDLTLLIAGDGRSTSATPAVNRPANHPDPGR